MEARTNVLTIGSGAWGHAIGWKLKQSSGVGELFFASGNAGTATAKIGTNLDIQLPPLNSPRSVWETFEHRVVIDSRFLGIRLVVVQDDNALAAGVVDHLHQYGIPAFGCSQAAAMIESSKVWADEFAASWELPKPLSLILNSFDEVSLKLLEAMVPCVVKADGLAGGKGVKACYTVEEAFNRIDLLMNKRILGDAGKKVVLQKFVEAQKLPPMPLLTEKLFSKCPYRLTPRKVEKVILARTPAGLVLSVIRTG